MHFGEIEIDLSARVARVAGTEVGMGPLEFRVLEYLARNAGIAVSRDQILSEVYGYDADISTERVDLVIRRLRQKLGEGLDRGGLLVAQLGWCYICMLLNQERQCLKVSHLCRFPFCWPLWPRPPRRASRRSISIMKPLAKF